MDHKDAALLTALGHKPLGIETVDRRAEFPESHPKYRFHCDCGYVSTNRAVFREAVSAGVHHMRQAAKNARANGVSVPKNVGATG